MMIPCYPKNYPQITPQKNNPMRIVLLSRVTWFTGIAKTWFTHLQPSADSPVNKLSVGSGKLGNDKFATACIE